jgi:hypothetical protein
VDHVINSQKGSWWNTNYCFPLACFKLTLTQSFVMVIGDRKHKNEYKSTCMVTSSMSNGKQAGLNLSYFMSLIQKKAVAWMPTTVFLLLVPS